MERHERTTTPCFIEADDEKSWVPGDFHAWSISLDYENRITPVAIVEYMNGDICHIPVKCVRFVSPDRRTRTA